MTNDETLKRSSIGKASGFTIIELLIVITIIIVLAGLVLATAGYVQNKAARSRAGAEIAAISAACENYKADNGVYPRGNHNNPGTGTAPFDTDNIDARMSGNPAATSYSYSSLYLYQILSGLNPDGTQMIPAIKSYIAFKPAQLMRPNNSQPVSASNLVTALRDPFGNSYGYSTYYTYDLETNPNTPPQHGYNPTFDLWSTGGVTTNSTPPDQTKWIKNW